MHKSLLGSIILKIVQVSCASRSCKREPPLKKQAHERSPTVPRAWESQTGEAFTVHFRRHDKTSVKGTALQVNLSVSNEVSLAVKE